MSNLSYVNRAIKQRGGTAEELLTPEEAARYLKTTRNTIYRWCRDGKLSALKVGGMWRIPRSSLKLQEPGEADGMYRSWPDVLDRLGEEESSHWAVITRAPEDVYDVEASFISLGLARGQRVVKGSWWQSAEEIRTELSARGLDVEAVERSGALVLMDMDAFYRKGGASAVVARWKELVESAQKLGFRGLWKTGSPTLDDRAPFEWVAEVEEAACSFFHRAKAHAICPMYTAGDHPEWHARLTRILGTHDVAVYHYANQNTLLRLVS
jgi:excisionase family DNA binding protein